MSRILWKAKPWRNTTDGWGRHPDVVGKRARAVYGSRDCEYRGGTEAAPRDRIPFRLAASDTLSRYHGAGDWVSSVAMANLTDNFDHLLDAPAGHSRRSSD